MNEFIQMLKNKAQEFKIIGDGESLRASGGYYGKSEAYLEIASMLEEYLVEKN